MGSLACLSILPIKRLGEDTDFASRAFWGWRMVRGICSVLSGQEHGPSGKHDSRVIEDPAEVELHEAVDGLGHEGMMLLGEHKVIGYTDRLGSGENDGVDQERVHGAETTDVEVDVDTAIVVEDEVADNVGSLDGVCITVEGVEEPTVVLGDELTGTGIGPKHVLATGV